MEWIINLSPQVQAAIISVCGVLITIIVTSAGLYLSYINNKKNLIVVSNKLQLDIINSEKQENDKLIDHQLNIIGEIKEKTSGLSEILSCIYILNNFLPSNIAYYSKFKEKNDKKNNKWLIDQNEEIRDILNKVRLQGFKTFSNETERDFMEQFCSRQQFNYRSLYEIIMPTFFNDLVGDLPFTRCNLLSKYASDINSNNEIFIQYCDQCLTSISKNMGNEKNIDMRYLLGKYPLTMDFDPNSLSLDEKTHIEMAIEEIKNYKLGNVRELIYTGEKCPPGYDYMSYIDIERKEKERDEKEKEKNSLFF